MRGDEDLVGRSAPLALLIDALDHDLPIAVVGEAGIGKTTIVRAAVAAAGGRLWAGGGFATLSWTPRLALERAMGAPLTGDAVVVAATVERIVGPDVLFVDDLQWIDDESAAALSLLAGRLTLVTAIRTGDAAGERALSLARGWGARELALDGLLDDDARLLARRLQSGLSESAIGSLVARSAGNPLLLEELAARGEVSPVVTRLLSVRFDRLSAGAREVVSLLAVVDRPLPAAGLSNLAEATANGLVVVEGGTARLRHELLAEAVRDRLAKAQSRRLHARAARVVNDPASAARHLIASGRPAAARRVVTESLPRTSDLRDRATLLGLLAESTSGDADEERRIEAGRAFDELSDWAAVERLLDVEPHNLAAEVVVGRAVLLARAAHAQGRIQEARRLLGEAESRSVLAGSQAAIDRVIEGARFAVNVDGAVDEAIARIDAALDDVHPDSAPAMALATLRSSIVLLATGDGDVDVLRAACDAALAAGAPRSATELARVVLYALLMHHGAALATSWAADRRGTFAAAGFASVAYLFQAEGVQAQVLDGRFAEAIAEADELLEQPAPIRARQAATIARARALGLLGRLAEATAALDRSRDELTDDFFGVGEASAVRAELASWSGRPDLAIRYADEALRRTAPVPGGDATRWLVRDWACLEARQPLGEPAIVPPIRSLAGAHIESRAIRALADGDPRSAAPAFAEAARLWAGFHAPRALMCRWAEGEAWRLGGEATFAIERQTEVLEIARLAGAEAIAARARRSLRTAGVRLSAARQRPGSAGLRLTAREAEVAELTRSGLTNSEIARRLGLGRPTVARMLASAMGKIGVGRRGQLAALMAGVGHPSGAGRSVRKSRLIVLESAALRDAPAILERLRDAGLIVAQGFTTTASSAAAVVCHGTVVSQDDAAAALAAAMAGRGLLVEARAPRETIDRLVDDLRRLGPTDHRSVQAVREPATAIGPDLLSLLSLLADGLTLGQAATALGLSRRTADRRLAHVRRLLDAERTTEAIARARSAGLLG